MAKLLRDFVRIENDFTIIPNEVLKNKEMKSSTKNILLTMFSLPPTWDFSIAGIASCVYEGRETVQKALVELEKIGYITRQRERRENGTFGAMIYTIHQFPVSQEENTYKNNFPNQDVKIQQQEKSEQDLETQLRTNSKLNNINDSNNSNISKECSVINNINYTDELNTDNYTSEKEKLFSEVEEGMYTSSLGRKKECAEKPKSRYIPEDYTEEQLIEHIYPIVCDEMEIQTDDGEYKPIDEFIEVVRMFHRKYQQHTGKRHRVLADVSYREIVRKFLYPPENMMNDDALYDVERYDLMIDKYFKIEMNKYGNYQGKITKSLSHFMCDKVREYIYFRIFLDGEED